MTESNSFFSVKDFGAIGDGITKNTAAINATIIAADKIGGGTIFFPSGTYLSGTIHLKDNITLYLSAGTVLLGSKEMEDYDPYEILNFDSFSDEETTYFHHALILGDGKNRIGIQGDGLINCNAVKRHGPKPISLKSCSQITIRDITIRNPPNYTISLMDCEFTTIENVTLFNTYADGIDLDNCRYAHISNCHLDCADDAICIKMSPALGKLGATTDVTITNCTIATSCNCIKIGTETSGDCNNIAVSNCVFYPKPFSRKAIGGIALEAVDGAHVNGIVIDNITMMNVYSPLFLRLGNRGRGQTPPTPGSLENISITNIMARQASKPTIISGIPGFPIKHVILENINIEMNRDAETPTELTTLSLEVPEKEDDYPDPRMFGVLPAWGIYARHVEDLTINKFHPHYEEVDPRPMLVCDDIQGLVIDDINYYENSRIEVIRNYGVLWLNQIRCGILRNNIIEGVEGMLIKITGRDTQKMHIGKNIIPETERTIQTDAEIDPDQIIL